MALGTTFAHIAKRHNLVLGHLVAPHVLEAALKMPEDLPAPESSRAIQTLLPVFKALLPQFPEATRKEIELSINFLSEGQGKIGDYAKAFLEEEGLKTKKEAATMHLKQSYQAILEKLRFFSSGMALSAHIETFKRMAFHAFLLRLLGEIDREKIVAKLHLEGEMNDIFRQKCERIREYIRRCSEEELKAFLVYLTGGTSVVENIRLAAIAPRPDGIVPLPVVHTCFNKLDISADGDPNQVIPNIRKAMGLTENIFDAI